MISVSIYKPRFLTFATPEGMVMTFYLAHLANFLIYYFIKNNYYHAKA